MEAASIEMIDNAVRAIGGIGGSGAKGSGDNYSNGGGGSVGRIRLDSNSCYSGPSSVSGPASCLSSATNPSSPYQGPFQGGEWADTFNTDFNNTASPKSSNFTNTTQTYDIGLPTIVGLKYTPSRNGSSNSDGELNVSGTINLMINDRNGAVSGNQPNAAAAKVNRIGVGLADIPVINEPAGCADFLSCFAMGDEMMVIEMYGQYAGQYESVLFLHF